MNQLSIGKIRGLQQISTKDGIFAICALDHRDSFRLMLNKEAPEKVDYHQIVEYKLELCQTLAPYASGILLDPNYGVAPCIAGNALPGNTGLLVSIEESGYIGDKEERLNTLLEGWDVEKIKRLGASAVKFLVFYRPDLISAAAKQLSTIKRIAEDCLKYEIPFLVEPRSYPVGKNESEPAQFALKKPEIVIETVRQISTLPVDVLKVEFPTDPNYEKDKNKLLELCHRLDQASPIPWVILSAGVDYETFCKEVEIACQAGASGFLGGRAIWQEAILIKDVPQRIKYLETVVVDRLKRLTEIAVKYGTPWYQKLRLKKHQLASISENWYRIY